MLDDAPKISPELRRFLQLATATLVLAGLAWSKEFLLPLVLAGLLSLVLTPPVRYLEKRGLPTVLAALGVVAVAFLVIAALSATISSQALDLVGSLPKYRSNILNRWETLRHGPPGPLNEAVRNLHDMVDDLTRASANAVEVSGAARPTKVEVVGGNENLLALAQGGLTPLVGPLTQSVVVVLLVVFMLLERSRLRRRFLRLVGHSHAATTTLALDEAGSRLSGFLLGQLQVNAGFALAVGLGLYFLGIPNAILWAVLTLNLRFLPYVGVWLSAACPIILSVATTTSWTVPAFTLGLYVFLEVFTNNAIEPIVLGNRTGMSPLAVIIAALFWTWLWGPLGLVLATPLTACLVVLGRYLPAFHFCSVLLASDPPTAREVQLTRYLTEERLAEAKTLVYAVTGDRLTLPAAEELIVPAVRAIENELFPTAASNPTKARIYGQMREILGGLAGPATPLPAGAPGGAERLAIVPFVGEGDEIVGHALALLLRSEGFDVELLSGKMLRSERLERLKESGPPRVLLSCVEVRSMQALDKMARALQASLPGVHILIGLWSLPPQGAARLLYRLRGVGVFGVYTRLQDVVRALVALRPAPEGEPTPGLRLPDPLLS